ncbi:cytochrome c oxidase subunit 2 [Natronocella acetinitrilica]|uniref:cytochrome-c oxidase n=1 Tax=Natronocella acetinitrilica TaxID=414046 RepID=A0AAE3G8X0_9GAMM|nr:cytochrome c oxidase subunit 2 [Natronocella acetinitrilica]
MSAESLVPFGLLFTSLLLAGCSGPLSTLDPAGPAAASTAWLWWGMFAFSTLVLIVVVALWLYAIRRDPGEVGDQQAQRVQNRWIIGGGFVLPLVSITALLGFGIPMGHNMTPLAADEDVLRIDVTAHRWWWAVSYPNEGITLRDELHIPVGVPVHVHVTSEDVIHSFWVPRLAGKLDAIPGHTNVLRLEADETGTFQGRCAEFCGVGHAHMHFTVEAHAQEAFDEWLQQAAQDDD